MAEINGVKTGFVLDRNGNKILPITHMSLVLGNDGKSILSTLDGLTEKTAGHDTAISDINTSIGDMNALLQIIGSKLSSVPTYDDLKVSDTLSEGSICYVIDEEKYYSYTSTNGWKEMVTSGNGNVVEDDKEDDSSDPIDDIYSHIWIGPEPPEDTSMVWIDTTSDGVVEDKNDLNLLYSLFDEVTELRQEVVSLRKRVKYLEENGVVIPGPGGGDDPTPDEPEIDDDFILLEDGSEILLEAGGELLLEKQEQNSEPTVKEEDIILLESGEELLLEDGSKLLTEIQPEVEVVPPTTDKGNILLFEDGAEALYEDGNNILLEM